MKYAYEAIMTNEFRTLDLECSNLVPLGPGYENITLENQVCAVVGAIPGQTAVNGLRYLKLSYDYDWSHMWRVRNRFIPYRTLIPLVLTSSSLEFWHRDRFWLCSPCCLPRHHLVRIQTRREAVCGRIQVRN